MKVLFFVGVFVIASGTKMELNNVKLTEMTEESPCETQCHSGCCHADQWICCEDNKHCAATIEDCPVASSKAELMEFTEDEGRDLECPGGTCPEDDWECCPGNLFCAKTKDHCP